MLETTKGLKSINVPLDKFEIFLTMENEEVGEMFKYLLQFAINDTEPTFRNKWQKIVYDSLASEVKHQKESNERRRSNCSIARCGTSKGRSTRKSVTKSPSKEEPASNEVVNDDAITSEIIDEDIEAPKSNKVEEVNTQDLTFTAFSSLYEKKDSGGYNTEVVWNSLTNEDKRSALAYIKENLIGKVYSQQRDYPSKFLSNHPWRK